MMKVTKKVALEVAINAIANSAIKEYHYAGSEETFSAEEVIAKLNGMMEQLEAKASAPKKPTKVQEANEGVKDIIKAALEGQSPKTVSEIQTLWPPSPTRRSHLWCDRWSRLVCWFALRRSGRLTSPSLRAEPETPKGVSFLLGCSRTGAASSFPQYGKPYKKFVANLCILPIAILSRMWYT